MRGGWSRAPIIVPNHTEGAPDSVGFGMPASREHDDTPFPPLRGGKRMIRLKLAVTISAQTAVNSS